MLLRPPDFQSSSCITDGTANLKMAPAAHRFGRVSLCRAFADLNGEAALYRLGGAAQRGTWPRLQFLLGAFLTLSMASLPASLRIYLIAR